MVPYRIFEGTGEEVAKYTLEHPHPRHRLLLLSDEKARSAEQEYTDEQFHADVRNAAKSLAELRAKA